ncbi:MAG: phage tail tape measure protein [Proteobacteria bacterium]|nr:phage tail tape measure protein [Pseudomonadota bacterium]NBP14238.1 phage tail tape measure protein [bacterium]
MAEGSQDIILNVAGNTRQLERDIQRVANSNLVLNTKGFSQPLGKITGQLGEFEKSLAASNARVIAFGVSAGAIYAVEKAFSAMVKSTISVQKSLAEINTILNTSQNNLNQFGNKLFEIAKNTGQSFDTVAKSALEFSRQGLGVADTLKRTSDALVLTRLSGLDVVSSTESITAALNSFNQTVISSNELVNKLIAVDTGFAVSSADLAEAIKRVGSSAQDAGVSLDELIALVTSAQQITSRGGSVIGNSFKTIFTRLQRPEVLNALDELGVKTRDAEGNIAPLIQILNQLSTTFESLSGTQKSQIAELVGGVFQINILKAALGDLSKEYSIFNQALATSQDATDEANKRNEALNNTLSSTLNKTLANLTKAASDVGGLSLAPAIKKSLDGLNGILETFSVSGGNTEGIGAKIGEGIAKGIGNFLGGPGIVLATLGLYKVFERLTKFSADAFKTLSGMNNASSQQAQIQSQVLNIMSKNPALIQQINKGNVDVASVHRQILGLIEQETVAMQQQIALASSLAKSLSAAGVGIGKSGALQGMVVSNKVLGKNKFSGYIPNFNRENNVEMLGAALGGYKAGNIKRTRIRNEGEVIYNDAESIVRYPGFEQEAILPPEGTKAGKLYRDNFIKQHGFDPYKSFGFTPNFAGKVLTSSIPKNYIRIQGDFADSLTDNIGRIKPEYDKLAYAQGRNVYVNRDQQDSLLKEFKIKQEKNLLNRDGSKSQAAEEYVLVYPSFGKGGIGKTSAIANKYSGTPLFKFSTFGFPGSKAGLGEELFKDVSDGLVNASAKFVSSIVTNPDIVNDEKFINSVKSNLSRSVIEGAIGGVFEAGIKSSINSIVDDPNAPLDLDSSELSNIAKKFKSANPLSQFEAGDLKNALNPSNAISMANKIANRKGLKRELGKSQNARNKNFGFIPNFSSIQEAIRREEIASGERAQVLWSDTLGSPVVVNNAQTAKYGKNADKIIRNDHIKQGQVASRANLLKTGSGKEKYTPNFAPKKWADSGWEDHDTMVRAGINASNFDLTQPYANVKKQIDKFTEIINKWINTGTEADATLKKVTQNLKQAENKAGKLLVDGIPLTPEAMLKQGGADPKKSGLGKIKDGLFSDDSLSQNMQNFKNKLVFASFGLSMIGGFASSLAGEDKQLSRAIDGTTQSLGAATTAMGIIPGPAGLAVGGFIGLAGAVNSLAHYLNDKGPAFAAALEEAKTETSSFADGTQKYSAAFQKAQDISSNPKAKTEDVVKVNKELNNAAKDIPSAYRLQLLAIQDNVALQEEINRIQKELIRKQSGLEFATDFQTKLDDKAAVPQFFQDYIKGMAGGGGEGFAGFLGQATQLGPSLLFGGADNVAGALGLTKLESGIIRVQDRFYEMIDNIAEKAKGTVIKTDQIGEQTALKITKQFSEEGQDKFEKDFADPNQASSIRGLGKNDFINKMQSDYGLDKNVAASLRNSTNEDINRLKEQIINLGREANETAQVMKKTEDVRETAKKQIEAEKKAIEKAKNSVDAFKNSLDSLAKTAIAFNNFQQRYSQQDSSNERSLSIEKARLGTEYIQPFLSPFEQAKLNFGIDKASRNEDFINQAQDIKSNTNKSMLDQTSSYLDKLKTRGIDEDKIRSANLDLAKINQNQSGEQLKNSIMDALNKNIGSDMSSGEISELNTELSSELNSQTQAMLTLNQKTDQANRIAEAQLAAQKAIAERDVYRGAFGGQSAMSNYNLEDERASAFENVDKNRGKAGFQTAQFSNTYDLIGGFTPDEYEENAKMDKIGSGRITDFMNGMVASRANDIRYQADTAIESIYRGARGRIGGLTGGERSQVDFLEKRRNQAGRIAAIQVAEKLKTGEADKNMGLNLQGISTDVKGIYGLLQEIASQQQDETISSGIQKALQGAISQHISGFGPTLDQERANLGEAIKIADATEISGQARIKEINKSTQRAVDQARLEEKQIQAGGFASQAYKTNPDLYKFINDNVRNAINNNQAIPSLDEIGEKSKTTNPEMSRNIKDLSKDTGSVQYQAFEGWIENARQMQILQQKLNEDIGSLQQNQNEINNYPQNMLSENQANQPVQNQMAGAPSPFNGFMPENLSRMGQQMLNQNYPQQNNPMQQVQSIVPTQNNLQNNQALNDSKVSPLDNIAAKLAKILQAAENPGAPSQDSSREDIKDLIKNSYQELKNQGAKPQSEEKEEKKELNGKVDISPVSVDGQVKVSLEGEQLSIKIDETDLINTKIALEEAMTEKIDQMKNDIFNQIKSFVDEAIDNKTSDLPNPYRFNSTSRG